MAKLHKRLSYKKCDHKMLVQLPIVQSDDEVMRRQFSHRFLVAQSIHQRKSIPICKLSSSFWHKCALNSDSQPLVCQKCRVCYVFKLAKQDDQSVHILKMFQNRPSKFHELYNTIWYMLAVHVYVTTLLVLRCRKRLRTAGIPNK